MTKVIDSRDNLLVTRRRRECLACHERYTTYERIEAAPEEPQALSDRDLLLGLRENLRAQEALITELLQRTR